MVFKFRPHHLVCNLCFQGKGYSTKFVENFSAINLALAANLSAKNIRIVDGVDDICSCCPKNKAGTCTDENLVSILDDSYRALLHLATNEIISLQDVQAKIKQQLSISHFHTTCGECSWMPLCKPIIKKITSS